MMSTVLRIINAVRLGLFPVGYGLIGALVGGVLNRIMIAEMSIPASLVGLFFAIPLLESPIRVWLGYRSDAYPIFNRRREPYIISGAILAGLGVVLIVLLMNSAPSAGLMLVGGGLLSFLVYGFGRNLGHNIFQALMADIYTGHQRARAATLYEVVTLLGAVVGAGGLGSALKVYEPQRLLAVTIGVAVIFSVLALLAAFGQEIRGKFSEDAALKARQLSFQQAISDVLLGDPQVRLFFFLVFFTFIGTLAQDVLLEPYGALVLNMSVGDTTRLTMYWGLGVMAGMLVSGVILIRLFGYMAIMRAGIIASILVFSGIIVVGIMGSPGAFRGLVFVMGLGTGLAGAGMLTGALNFTTAIRAGMLMGVWGMANLLGKATGSLMGGVVVDVVKGVTGSAFNAYASVFAIEVIMLVIALALSFRFNVAAAKAAQEERLALEAAAG